MPASPSRVPALERRRKIASLVRERGSVRAGDLSQLLGVGDETIRRDLLRLEQMGILRRLHGGAVAERTRFESTFSGRLREHEAEKRAIGQAAAALVADGSAIIIDSGSTMVHFARALHAKRDLVVITNAVTNAVELMENQNITVVLVGGVIRPATFGAVGDMTVANLGELRVDQTFLAIAGVSIDGGLTYPSFEEAAVKRAMISAASEVILLADASKFGRDSFVRVAPLDVLTRIITSPNIDPRLEAHLRGIAVDAVVVAAADAQDGQLTSDIAAPEAEAIDETYLVPPSR